MLKKGRRFKVSLVFACMLFLLGSSIKVCAGEGEIWIRLEELHTDNSDREDVEIILYRVGDVSEEGTAVFDESYGIKGYPEDSASLEKTAEELADRVKSDPVSIQKTDAEGQVCFAGLENGIYLVVIPKGNGYGNVMPFLVSLPYYQKADDAVCSPCYIVHAKPKASPYHDDNDDGDDSDDGGGSDDGGREAEQTASPQTGDETCAWLWLVTAAVSLTGITVGIMNRRKRP